MRRDERQLYQKTYYDWDTYYGGFNTNYAYYTYNTRYENYQALYAYSCEELNKAYSTRCIYGTYEKLYATGYKRGYPVGNLGGTFYEKTYGCCNNGSYSLTRYDVATSEFKYNNTYYTYNDGYWGWKVYIQKKYLPLQVYVTGYILSTAEYRYISSGYFMRYAKYYGYQYYRDIYVISYTNYYRYYYTGPFTSNYYIYSRTYLYK